MMFEHNILCPECLKAKLKNTFKANHVYCPNCNTKFKVTGKNQVRYE